VYKAGEKDTLPLDKVQAEISSTMRSQRMQDALQKIQQSATPELNEKYFADAPAPEAGTQDDTGAKPAMKAPPSGPK
jgi:hypothetical protein